MNRGILNGVRREVVGFRTVGDENVVLSPNDRLVVYTVALTATRTCYLPNAAAVPPGTVITVQDGAGTAATFGALITVATNSSDATVGYAFGLSLAANNGRVQFISDGNKSWYPSGNAPQLIAAGGTGQTTAGGAADALLGTATRGDIPYRGATAVLALGKGNSGQYLKQGTNDPAWATPVLADINDWPLSVRGDLVYQGAAAAAKLGKGTSGQYLQIGANDPAWASIQASDVAHSYSNLGVDHSAPTLTNPTSLTSFGTTISLPANNAVLDDVYELVVAGLYTNTTTSTQVEFKLFLGSVVIMDWTCTSLTSNANARRWGFRVVMLVKTAGASGQFFADVDAYITPGQALSSSLAEMSVGGGAGGILARNMVNPTGIDFTSSLSFDLQAKFVTSSASQTIQQRLLRINKFAA